MRKLFLDLDGVIFDFDKRAKEILQMNPHDFEERYGTKAFWRTIYSDRNFFLNLELMEDARELFDFAKQFDFAFLTGLPSNPTAAIHKVAAVKKHFGDQEVITCKSREKCNYCYPGDILVDDMVKYKHLWEENGGIYIVHKSAKDSIEQLKRILND